MATNTIREPVINNPQHVGVCMKYHGDIQLLLESEIVYLTLVVSMFASISQSVDVM